MNVSKTVGLRRAVAGAAAATLALAACGSSSTSAGSATTSGSGSGSGGGGAATGSTITIGYVSNLTGVASSTFADGAAGAQAMVDAINAKGGVNGHKLKIIVKDDASSVAGNLTASKEVVADGAKVVIEYSSFAFASAPYLQKAGIPVVGSGFDGPEWASQPYTNMFSFAAPTSSPVGGKLYTTTALGTFLKGLGVTSFGGLGYGISPSSTDSILASNKSVEAAGLKVCYTNNSVPFGAVDFTADVLQIKSAGCGAVAGSFVGASDVALSTAMKQGGLAAVKQIFFTGYDSTTSGTPSTAAAFNGDYAQASVNFSPPSAAGQTFLSTLKQYDPSFTGSIPDFGLLGSAISVQLAAYGLGLAGSNPSSSAFISKLRQVSSWDDNGLLSDNPAHFTGFGTAAQLGTQGCAFYEQLNNGQWSPATGKAICGPYISFPAPST